MKPLKIRGKGGAGTLAVIAAAGLALTLSVPAQASPIPTEKLPAPGPGVEKQYKPTDDYTAVWSRADAPKVQANATNTIPEIPHSGTPVTSDKVFLGDAWPLTNLNGDVVKVGEWNVMFSLTNTKALPFHHPDAWAHIGYYYSKDAKNWTYGGNLFPEGTSLGSRTWSGSTTIEGKDEITAYYTAVGATGAAPDHADGQQRLASAKGKIVADKNGVHFTGFGKGDHKILAEPDGVMYQTWDQYKAGQPKTQFPGFRDPWVFKDPKDGNTYMLFHGSKGGNPDANTCSKEDIGDVPAGHEVPEDSKYFVGSVGIAMATNKDLTQWKLLPPLLSANCVSQELERPHFIFKDNKYYLFVDEHRHKFAPGLTGPDGLYGFVGSSLRSNYKGLNGSSLVLANPATANNQSFAWNITPNGLVQSFLFDRPGGEPGGSFAPTVKFDITGDSTKFVEELDYGYVPETTSQQNHPKAGQPKLH